MPQSVGDAVLTFIGDTTQLDQAYARVAVGADAAMSSAAASVDGVGDALRGVEYELDATASNAAYAGGMLEEVGKKAKSSFGEARESMMLTEETLGIHLPRAMNGLLAHIPMIAVAFEAMLPLIGVIAAIDIIGKLVEKHDKLEHAQQKSALAAENLSLKERDQTESIALANLKLDDQIAKLEGRPETNKLKEALAESAKSVDALASAFADKFEKIDEQLEKTTGFMGRLVQDAYAWSDLLSAGWGKIGQSWDNLIKGGGRVADALEQVHGQMVAINKLRAAPIGKTEQEQVAHAQALADAYGVLKDKATLATKIVQASAPHEKDAIDQLTAATISASAAQNDFGMKVEEIHKNAVVAVKETAAATAELQEKGAKQALDAQLAAIDSWKARQHAAYASGAIDAAAWAVSEVQASDASAIAHETYLGKMLAAARESGNALKIQAAQQELVNYQTKTAAEDVDKLAAAEEKHVLATRKIVKEYGDLVDTAVIKDFEATQKATEGLVKADEELSKAQTKLKEVALADSFRDQEEAITRLAAMHLISEQQKDDRLKLLEQRQAQDAIAILNDQLAKEKAVMDTAQAKVTAAKANPFFSDAQVLDLQINLTKAKTAITNTQAQIVQTQEKFNKESEANDKSHYGRSLLLAIAAGRQLLAETMQENHAALLAAQAKLAEAKAHGTNTAAIEKEITARKQNEQTLDKEAKGNKQVLAAQLQLTKSQLLATQAILADAKARGMDTTAIEKHIQALKAEAVALQQGQTATGNLGLAISQLKSTTNEAATEMLSSLSTAFAGIITGQQSFGKSMEDATFKMIGGMATKWAEYYAAKGLATVWDDPPLGAAELAASAALFALSGVMSGLSSPSASGTGSNAGRASSQQVSQSSSAGGGTQQTQQTPHLATGGIVSKATTFMAGDSPSGGDAEEAIIPLSDPTALARISNALLSSPTLRAASAGMNSPAAAMVAAPSQSGGSSASGGEGGGDTHHHTHVAVKGLISPDNLKKVIKQQNRLVQNRQASVKATDSLRVTRRSQ